MWDGETRFLRPDRSVVRSNVRASELRDGGTRRHALIFVSEISRDNGAAVAPLGEEHLLLRQLVDHVPGMLAYWDATQRCRFANRAYESWFGVPCAALVGRSMQELLGPIYPPNLPYIEGALRGVPQTFERDIPLANGSPMRHSLAQYVPHVVEGAVRGFFVLVSDTSSLRDAEKRFRAVIEATPIPYSLNDEHSNVTYLNPEFVRVFGYTTQDISTLAEWWPRAYPDETYREWVTQEWVARLATADRERAPFEPLEVRIQAKDGTAKTVLASAAALGGSFGGSRLVVLYDVTEARRLEGERKHLESLLTHSQRLEGIGRLAGGIAHDFNNLLSVIVAYCELLVGDLRDGDPRRADLGEIMNAAQRAAALTRQLLTFSRREPQTVEHVDMSALLTRTARMLERVLGEDVRLEITGNDRPHVTLADAGQLEQIVMKLAAEPPTTTWRRALTSSSR